MNLRKYAIIDLHLHLDGSLSARSILDVSRILGIDLPANNERDLTPHLRAPENCQSLNDYLERFELPNRVLKSRLGLMECTLDLLERLARDGIKYVEIRMAPQLSEERLLSQRSVVRTLIRACKIGRKYGIFSNLILCLMRGETNHEKNFETIEIAKKFLGRGVVAVDIAGAEALYPNELFEEEFNLINMYGIPSTIHAGEAAGAGSVKSALRYNPVRIGHGIHSADDPVVMQMIKDRDILLEICPKSNLDTKTINSFEELPLRQFMEKGIKFSINTDDMTVSNTTLLDNFQVLVDLGLTEKEIQKIAFDSIEASFADEKTKQYLRKLIS